MTKIMKFTPEIFDILKAYVYMYVDPRDNQPFYIGRGQRNRAFDHLNEQSESKKVLKIKAIRESGHEPHIEILRYGLSESEASLVEAAAIDLLGPFKLTNACRGENSKGLGRISSKELATMLTAKPVTITQRAILLIINKLYRSNMSANELYEATRGFWKVDRLRAEKAEFAMAVYQGIVREIYRINKWRPAGTTEYQTRDGSKFRDSGKWEFEGEVAVEIKEQYFEMSVRDYLGQKSQNPIRYVNI